MEIQNQSMPVPRPSPGGSKDWPRIDVTRDNRAWIRQATDETIQEQRPEPGELDNETARLQRADALARTKVAQETARGVTEKSGSRTDRLDLSEEAKRLSEQAIQSAEPTEAERARVQELRALHEKGELNTYERVQRAAERMLGASLDTQA